MANANDDETAQRAQKSAITSPFSVSGKIGGYEIERVLGRGGMGLVFLARDPRLQRFVAVKVLTESGLFSPEAHTRFQTEARAIARVHHPNIADVYEIGEDQGRPFLVMEYLSGGTLTERIRDKLPPPSTAGVYVETLARAVHAAHECGIIHRDLKPSNVMFAQDETLKVTDFGMAKRIDLADHATLTGQILGTPGYMAPEQAGGVVKNLGRECDVYALGSILYELLCGRPPFHSPDPVETILLVLSTDPVSVLKLQPQSPRDLATICMKCLEKAPRRRYPTALELAEDLERFREGFPIRARPVSKWERARRWSKRNPSKALLAAVIVVSLAALLFGGAWYNGLLQRELQRSNELVAQGRDFAQWVLGDHMPKVSTLAGSTEVQEKLVQQLRDYLDQLANSASSDDSLVATIARAYTRIAHIQGSPDEPNLGDSAGALQSAQTAEKLYERAIQNTPNDPELQLAYLVCRRLVIKLKHSLGEKIDTRKNFESLRSGLNELSRQVADPGKAQMVDLMFASDLAWLDLEEGNLARATQRFEQSVELAESMVQPNPTDPMYLSTLHNLRKDLAHALELHGEFERALAEVEQLVEQSRRDVVQEPTNAWLRQRLATELVFRGDLLSIQRDAEGGLSAYLEAETIRRQLLSLDPKNAWFERDLVVCLNRLAGALLVLEDFDAATKALQEAIERHSRLLQGDPRNVDLRRTDWILKKLSAQLAMRQGKIDESIATLEQAKAGAEALLADDDSRVKDWYGVAETCDYLANALLSRPIELQQDADLTKALEFADQSLAAIKQIESRGNLSAAQRERKNAVERTRSILQKAIDSLKALEID